MREQKNIKNLDLASEYVKNIAKEKTTIYNAVISLKKEDAVAKGYDKRCAWEDMIKENIYSIAKKMNIPRIFLCCTHVERTPSFTFNVLG